MAIYRGPGGAGDATVDATNTSALALTAKNEAQASATSAASSATAAASSATSASTSATEAATSATNAAGSATTASTAATNASTYATNASNSATTAASEASDAADSATAAASSASDASGYADTASTQATNAASSASSASTSASTATAAKDAALAALDSFDDRYLGAKTTDPTLDNDGNALAAGALYYNTTTDVMKVYEGSSWVAAYASLSGALLSTNNLSDLGSASTARTNLGLGTAATTAASAYATSAQGTTADSAYADRLKWDGGATGLTASTGRTSLGLGTAATTDATAYATAAQGTKADSALQPSAAASVTTLTTSSTVTHNGGTANGVAYLNGSKVLTTGSALVFDGTNLGLGVTSVIGKMHVNVGDITPTSTAANMNGFVISKNNDGVGLSFGTADTAGYTWISSGYVNSASTARPLAFFTGGTERARIDSSGNLLVGTTSGSWTTVSKSNSGSYAMTITNPNYGAGDGCLIVKAGNGSSGPYIINCESNSAAVFRVYGNGTYGTVSDVNLKKNIETARGYLDDLLQLRVVKYNWKTQEDAEPKELGFIAQEVESVFPGLVETSTREGEMDNKLIKQPVLIPMLVKAIQEQQALITQLQADVAALKGQA